MITINLLPEEYRPQPGITPKKAALIAAGALVNASLLAWWGWLSIGVSATMSSELAQLDEEMSGLTPQVDFHRGLEAEHRQYLSREGTLEEITSERISWTRKLDEMVDLIDHGSKASRYLVWLGNLNVSQVADPRRDAYGMFRAEGFSGSGNFANVANYLEDLEDSSFARGFNPPAPPEGSQSKVDEDLVPSEVWSFPVELSLKSPEERKADGSK
jgi:Tfp pilus assembly protein PilN